MFDFDQALDEIGEFGRFQIVNYLLLCLPVFFSAGNSLTYVFTAGAPNYRCFVPECENITTSYSQTWLEAAIPRETEEDLGKPGEYFPSKCYRYEPKNDADFECSESHFTNSAKKCESWVFEDNEWTIVGEWNITCVESQWKLSMVGTVHFLGILIGTMLFGFLADRYGRKIVFVFCIVLMSITGIAQALSSDYFVFQIFVFVNALGTSGVYPLAFILGVELVGRKKREMSGVILNYFYALGEASIALIAWMWKNWVTLQLAISVPPMLFAFYYWLIPESVRWLLANKKNLQASLIVQKAARVNGVSLSTRLIRAIENNDPHEDGIDDKVEEPSLGETCKKLLQSKSLLFRSFLLFYIWAANAFVYYGLSVNSTSLAGNKYLNFSLVCLVEIPGYTLSWWAMNNLGRRWSLTCSLLLCSVTCIAAAFIPSDFDYATIVLFLLGKLGITSSFGIAYVYTAELYPTIVRSMGVGASSTMARLGAVVAPFAPLLATYNKTLPLMLFSGISICAGILTLLLPETLGSKLPNTIEEAEKLKLMKMTATERNENIPAANEI